METSNAPSTERGQIGRQSFEATRALIQEGKKPTEAFAIVAERTGRSPATVATAYYRIARTEPDGAGVKARKRSRGSSTAATAPRKSRSRQTARSVSRTGTASAEVSDLVRDLVDAANALAEHVARLDRENTEYRTITHALERLRR